MTTARQVFDQLQADGLVQMMKEGGFILEDIYDPTDKIAKPNIDDTSDPRWSPSIQRSWPYFIMGVSRTWLHLVAETAVQMGAEQQTSTLVELLNL